MTGQVLVLETMQQLVTLALHVSYTQFGTHFIVENSFLISLRLIKFSKIEVYHNI